MWATALPFVIPRNRLACGKLSEQRHSKIAMDARPGGPSAKRKPSPEGLGINPKMIGAP
jgi:hypothetical protein